jgi:glycosyltransferase involved in cell wall biosynthesis
MLYKLLSEVDQKRFTPVVISLSDKGTIGPQIEQLGIPVYTLGMRPGMPSPRVLCKLALLTRKIRPEIIQGWMYHGNVAALYSGIFSKPSHVCWNIRHSLYSLTYEKKTTALIIRLCGRLSKLPSKIIYNARQSVVQHVRLGYQKETAVIIPNGFNIDLFQPDGDAAGNMRAELNIPAASILIGLVARYHPMKDHENFLRAASILVRDHPETHFVLAGKNVTNKNHDLLQLIETFGIAKNVHLLGERKDVPFISASFDIATSSSYSEAFPNVVGEAMSCGVPCVVTDVGDSAWIVADTGKVVPPRDPQSLADAWSELISMGGEKRRELGLKARKRICDNFSLDVVTRKYETLYEQLAGQKGRN